MMNYVSNANGTKHIQNMDYDRKMQVIKEHIHKFTYDDISKFFETSENENAKIIQDLEDRIEDLEDTISELEDKIYDLENIAE